MTARSAGLSGKGGRELQRGRGGNWPQVTQEAVCPGEQAAARRGLFERLL